MRALDPEKGVPGTPPGSSGGTAGLWVSSGRSWRSFGRVWGRSWRALGGSGGALGELWEGLGELWDVSANSLEYLQNVRILKMCAR